MRGLVAQSPFLLVLIRNKSSFSSLLIGSLHCCVMQEARCADRGGHFEDLVDEMYMNTLKWSTLTITPFRGGPDCSSLLTPRQSICHGNRLDWRFYIVVDNGFTRGRKCNGMMNRCSHTWVVLSLDSFSNHHFTLMCS